MMSFGEGLRPAGTPHPAEWLLTSRGGRPGTVGALVPNHYEAFLRVSAPDPSPDGWWSSYRELYGDIAAVGKAHTTTPERAWVAIWDGHGFDNDPGKEAEVRSRDESVQASHLPCSVGGDDQKDDTSNGDPLRAIPKLILPDRSYYLLTGAVDSVNTLTYPGFDGWRNPDLFWPDDRRWFVATDVDFWSVYVAGEADFIVELARTVPTQAEEVELIDAIPLED